MDLYILIKIPVIIIVAITETILAVVAGNLKPRGAWRIYPTAINIHTIEGINVIKYGFFFLIK